MRKKLLLLPLLFCLASHARAGGCQLPCVQVTSESLAWDFVEGPFNGSPQQITATSYHLHLPNPSLSGNGFVMYCTLADGQTISSVADNQSNAWTQDATVDDSGQTTRLYLYHVPNATAGTRDITVTPSAGASFMDCAVAEFEHLAQSSMLDVASSNNGSSTSGTAGSLAVTQTGDLLFHCVIKDGTSAQGDRAATGFTVGSQPNISWHLLNAQLLDGVACQWGIYNSTSAITPSLTLAGSDTHFVSVAAAFKSDNTKGSPASGIRVVSIQHEDMPNKIHSPAVLGYAATQKFQFPCVGNLIVAAFDVGSNTTPNFGTAGSGSSFTDSNNSWIATTTEQMPSGGVTTEQMAYAPSATCSDSETVTIAFGGTGADASLLFYDIADANLPYPFDKAIGANGDQTTQGTLNALSITPYQPLGVIVTTIGVGFNTIGTMGSGQDVDDGWYGGAANTLVESGPSPVDNNDGNGHIYPSSTSPITEQFTGEFTSSCGNGVGDACSYADWAALAIHFLGIPAVMRGTPTYGSVTYGAVIYGQGTWIAF